MQAYLDGRQISSVLWPDTETSKGRCLMSGYGVGDLHLSVSESGEAWIVQIAGGVEVARHNPRYVETIEWKR